MKELKILLKKTQQLDLIASHFKDEEKWATGPKSNSSGVGDPGLDFSLTPGQLFKSHIGEH